MIFQCNTKGHFKGLRKDPTENMPGIYEYITQIDQNEKVIYLGILVVCLYLFTNGIVDIRAGHGFAIAVTLGIVWYMSDRQLNSETTFNASLANKLADLPGVKYFHLDPDMINIFHSISGDLAQLNPKVYMDALKSIDSLLKIRSNFETGALTSNPFESFQVAEQQGKTALNSCHSFVHSISDNTVLYDKHTAFVQRLQLLIQRNLDYMKGEMDSSVSAKLDVNTHFVDDYNGPVSIDKARGTTLSESLFNFY